MRMCHCVESLGNIIVCSFSNRKGTLTHGPILVGLRAVVGCLIGLYLSHMP